MKIPTLMQRPAAIKLLTVLTCLHLIGSIALLIVLYAAADSWWPATVLMFGPRWVWALPLAILAPFAALMRPRLLIVACIDLALILGPLMGFNVPSFSSPGNAEAAVHLRVMTCNVHWKELDGGALGRLIEAERPEIVALQGWSSRHQSEVFGSANWHLHRSGELILASAFPIVETHEPLEGAFPKPGAALHAVLASPAGKLHFVNIHLASPRDGLVSVAKERWKGADAMRLNTERRHDQADLVTGETSLLQGPLLIAGDFNTPPESVLMREFWSPYTDAFGSAAWGWGHTHFTRWESSRIDHIMVGSGWYTRQCRVGPNVGSPHRPLIADLEWHGR